MMRRHQSTATGTFRRPPVIIDMQVERPIIPAMGGFFDTLISSGTDLLKNTVGTAATGAINTQLELEKIKAQAKIDAARRAAEAKANGSTSTSTSSTPATTYVPASLPWYQDPKIMLPVALALAGGLYFIRARRARR